MSKQNILENEYREVVAGLLHLATAVRAYGAPLPAKLEAMERTFLGKMQVYESAELKRIQYFREAYCYKFHLANLHLEELWSLTHLGARRPRLWELLSNIYDRHETDDDYALLPSMAFEGFIVQGKSFLDFYMLHACAIFKVDETRYLSSDKFMHALGEVVHVDFGERPKEVKKYFETKVFNEEATGAMPSSNWGNLLKTLRDSLVHRDIMSPDFEHDLTLLDRLLGPWPKNDEDLDYSRFAQDVQNVMFEMITELAASIYGLEWKPGPYRDGMW